MTKEIADYAHARSVSVEGEIGCLGASEGGAFTQSAMYTDPMQAKEFTKRTGVDALAISIGTSHGNYPEGMVPKFDIERLKEIKSLTGAPLVLHGGTGIPDDMIKKAISLGVAKINVNTECQLSFADATRKYIEAGKDLEGKGFDPRKLLAPGAEAIKATVKEKMELFGSVGKAE